MRPPGASQSRAATRALCIASSTGPGQTRLPAPSVKWVVVANTDQYPKSHGSPPLSHCKCSFESWASAAATDPLLPEPPPSYSVPAAQPRVLGILCSRHPQLPEVLRVHLLVSKLHSRLGFPKLYQSTHDPSYQSMAPITSTPLDIAYFFSCCVCCLR